MTAPTGDNIRPQSIMLGALVDLANALVAEDDITMEVGVTVNTHGLVISGVVIPDREYFSRLGDQFETGFAGGSMAVVGTRMRETIAAAPDMVAWRRKSRQQQARRSTGATNTAEGGQPDRRVLYLKDVTIMTGNTPLRTPLWEGYLDAIVGWTLGRP